MSNYFQLPDLTAVSVSGPDALAFCQAQLTADLTSAPRGRWQVCAWCDPKGRCKVIILAAVHEDSVDLIAPKDQASILAQLSLYAIGRRVKLSEPMPVAGSWSAEPGAILLEETPARALMVNRVAEADPDAARAWRIADLCQGIPWLPAGQAGRHLPQFLGLENNAGLSYRKGCFPGQEVIARVHYLGKVKHQLLGFVIECALTEGAELCLVSGEQEGQADALDHIQVGGRSIGLAVCPSAWLADTVIEAPGPGAAAHGRMVSLERLCYYREE